MRESRGRWFIRSAGGSHKVHGLPALSFLSFLYEPAAIAIIPNSASVKFFHKKTASPKKARPIRSKKHLIERNQCSPKSNNAKQKAKYKRSKAQSAKRERAERKKEPTSAALRRPSISFLHIPSSFFQHIAAAKLI